MRAHLHMLARYNVWASQRLYEHVDRLTDADYQRDLGLFFHSVHRTLNHLLVAEHLLWRVRFAQGESPKVALDAEAEPDRQRLRERLLQGAAAWPELIAGWPGERFASTLTYTRMNGETLSLPVAATLAHVFNHGTHHRGQISAALTAMGHACPELDLVYMLQHEGRQVR
jgi:uncharacterized damage-inducible protein DinB